MGRVAAAARPLPVTARGQRTRQKLIDAAEHVFGGAGYHEAGIAELTQCAGVGLGTFYLYFPDKHAIFADLVRTLNHRLRADIQAAIGGLDDRVDQEIAGFDIGENPIQALGLMINGALGSLKGWTYLLYYATNFIFDNCLVFLIQVMNFNRENPACNISITQFNVSAKPHP